MGLGKKIALGVVGVVVVGAVGGGAFYAVNASAFDASMDKVYDVPLPKVERSTDPAVLARGKHVVEALAGCSSADCHGADLGGGRPLVMGPVGTFTGPNVTTGGLLAAYSDAELVRLVRNGLKRDGRSLVFMPVQDFNWLRDEDLVAMASYLRTVPAVSKANGVTKVGPIGKLLDRKDKLPLDIARRINHQKPDLAPLPSADATYGKYLGRLCTGCHGEGLSGGRIPGAPKSLPIPLNLTPDPSGLAGWQYADFDKLLTQGLRKNGAKLDPFMPISAYGQMDETEKKALYAYLMSLPPKPFGGR